MNTSYYIAIVSIAVTTIIAIVGGIYAVASNTKKFELAEAYKKEILDWYSDTINVMISILSKVKNEKKDYNDELSKLSAQIEIGRFYFPNINKRDGFGEKKPSAYQGYRNVVLEFLVYFYDTAKRNDANVHLKVLSEFLRLYTSSVFDVISPKDRIKMIKKYSDFTMDKEVSLEDFLKDESNFNRFYEERY